MKKNNNKNSCASSSILKEVWSVFVFKTDCNKKPVLEQKGTTPSGNTDAVVWCGGTESLTGRLMGDQGGWWELAGMWRLTEGGGCPLQYGGDTLGATTQKLKKNPPKKRNTHLTFLLGYSSKEILDS